ncbi:MAG: response regulator [Acidobacteriia bacterium]|nr:response regulator [Terriglobia bacterium]
MGGTLLLADDSITIQKVVELTFAETEHKVVTVGSGRDLFGRLAEVKPDVVLCDVVMPDMNGYEVCQTLKSDPNTLHLPVVLLTGTFEPFDRDRAVAAGCDAIVTKPFEARELINIVEDLLKRAQSLAALPMPGEGGGLEDQGIPEGVPALEFSTTGFENLAAKIPPPPPMPEEGIELTASSLGNSHPSAPMQAPPELAGPEVSTAASAISQSFAFGGEEPEVVAEPPHIEPPHAEPAPTGEAFAQEEAPVVGEDQSFATMRVPTPGMPLPAPEPPAFPPEPPAFAPEPPAFAPEPPAFAPEPPALEVAPSAAEPFLTEERVESAQELFAAEPAPPPVVEAESTSAPLPSGRGFDEGPTQRFPVEPAPEPVAQPVSPAPSPAEPLLAVAAPLVGGAVSAEVVEHIARRVKEMIPQALSAPPPPTIAESLTDEHVERIAKRAAELVPQRPAAATVSAELSEEQIEKIAKKVIELSAPQLERIAWEVIPDMAEMMVRRRIAELEKAAEEEA